MTGWRIDPATLRLTHPCLLNDGDEAVFTASQFAEQQWPPCPVCGATVEVDSLYVTLNEEDQRLNGDTYIPGRWDCPRSCDVAAGEKRHLSNESGRSGDAGWYFRCSCGVDEKYLTDDEFDRLREQHQLTTR